MLNYIRAELYKVTHRAYTWIMLALIFLGEGFMFLVWFDNRKYMTFFEAVHVVGMMMIMGFFATLFTCDMVFAGQHQNGTLKNEVSFGLSRSKIYLGKFIAMTLLSLLAMVIALGVYLAVCGIMLSDADGLAIIVPEMVGLWIFTELPVWLGCQAVICAASFLMNSVIVANVVTVGVVLGSHYIVGFLALFLHSGNPLVPFLAKLNSWLPYEPLLTIDPGIAGLRQVGMVPRYVVDIDWTGIRNAWIIGGFWLIFATAVGLYFFRKKEIK